MRSIRWYVLASLLTIALFALPVTNVLATDVPRITKEQLAAMMEKEDIVLIDVRTSGDWEASEWKIKGARRENPKEVQSWIDKYPKDKTLILYCA